jgi:hypothetical protein
MFKKINPFGALHKTVARPEDGPAESLSQLDTGEESRLYAFDDRGNLVSASEMGLESTHGSRRREFGRDNRAMMFSTKDGYGFVQTEELADDSVKLTDDSVKRRAGGEKHLSAQQIRDAESTPYHYRPVRSTPWTTATRLISFDYNIKASEAVAVKIEMMDVNKVHFTTPYAAVSYVWGKGDPTHSVLCEEGTSSLKVPRRLYSLLKQLRGFGLKERLWIDAICISQSDLIERSAQVQQMASIYKQASRVLAFLGTPDLLPSSCLESAWFSRRWVVQEFIAAGRVSFFSESLRFVDHRDSRSLFVDFRTALSDGKLPAGTIGRPAARLMQELGEIQAHGHRRLGILSLLLVFHQTECQDDRDRLFAFFAIAHDIASPGSQKADSTSAAIISALIKFTPDYQSSTAEVYVDFAAAALRCAYPIDILHCAGAFRAKRTAKTRTVQDHESLPSWVPDWRLPPLFLPLMKAEHCKAGCPPDSRTRPSIAVDQLNRQVTIKGVQVGRVVKTYAVGVEGVDTAVHVSYLRSGDLDVSADRTAFELFDDIQNYIKGYEPVDIEAGDVVVVFAGARTPFILRAAGPGLYVIVGDAFVPELVDGTVFTSASKDGLKDFVLV